MNPPLSSNILVAPEIWEPHDQHSPGSLPPARGVKEKAYIPVQGYVHNTLGYFVSIPGAIFYKLMAFHWMFTQHISRCLGFLLASNINCSSQHDGLDMYKSFCE